MLPKDDDALAPARRPLSPGESPSRPRPRPHPERGVTPGSSNDTATCPSAGETGGRDATGTNCIAAAAPASPEGLDNRSRRSASRLFCRESEPAGAGVNTAGAAREATVPASVVPDFLPASVVPDLDPPNAPNPNPPARRRSGASGVGVDDAFPIPPEGEKLGENPGASVGTGARGRARSPGRTAVDVEDATRDGFGSEPSRDGDTETTALPALLAAASASAMARASLARPARTSSAADHRFASSAVPATRSSVRPWLTREKQWDGGPTRLRCFSKVLVACPWTTVCTSWSGSLESSAGAAASLGSPHWSSVMARVTRKKRILGLAVGALNGSLVSSPPARTLRRCASGTSLRAMPMPPPLALEPTP